MWTRCLGRNQKTKNLGGLSSVNLEAELRNKLKQKLFAAARRNLVLVE